ncbi:MAG: FkbM family methyltransferase [Pseudomonadota bacterium]|nr:FkbM family methyltransferase [Pseudomonadota bacterium]
MSSTLAKLFRNLFTLRRYRAGRGEKQPWRIRLAYFRNVIRHQALDTWPGGYIQRGDGRLAYVPAHVDVTAGYRLMKPDSDNVQVDLLCRPGDCVLDIGANVGDWTLAMALRVGPVGRVLAFEPVPYLAETVAKTARINRHDWVEVHNLALSAADGTAEFSVEQGNSGGSRLGRMEGDFSMTTVPTRRLDSLLEGRPDINRIDFIKIDVEGHELEVLEGARATLARFQPPMILESGHESDDERRAQADLLVGLGYDIIGAFVPGGLVEIGWQDYRERSGEVARLGLCNYLFMPAVSRQAIA